MRFEGKIFKAGTKKESLWGVEIPILRIHTQGKSRKDAYVMAADAIESLVDREGFKVRVFPGTDDTFTIDSNNSALFISFMLRRQREFQRLTVREVASRLNAKSPNSYAQYENGKINPSIDKLVELLKAIDPEFEPILKAG